MKLYVIYDPIAAHASPVWEAKNDAVALREFKKFASNNKDPAADDYQLYYIGEFHEERLLMESEIPARRIVTLTIEALKAEEDQPVLLTENAHE